MVPGTLCQYKIEKQFRINFKSGTKSTPKTGTKSRYIMLKHQIELSQNPIKNTETI